MQYDKGDLVWFDPGLGYVLPGEVVEFHRAGQVITVQAVISAKRQVFTLTNLSSVRRRQSLGEDGVQDMIDSSELNEASMLWNLKIRYDKEKIYTYAGSILVAVNPYRRMFDDVYGLDMVRKYQGAILGALPPHIFAIGSVAYSNMAIPDGGPQCVVVSGESGSGKTESTKLIMQYLAAVSQTTNNLLTEQVLETSPLLESFGNAATPVNDSSSRFGKYIECYFRNGVMLGARLRIFLPETCRVVSQAFDERNFRVFYEMLAGLPAERKTKYGLTSADKYFYLNQGGDGCPQTTAKDDAADFDSLQAALQVFAFSGPEQDATFRILSAILHLGNVYFERKQLRHNLEGVDIGSGGEAELQWVAHLLKVEVEDLKRALTIKVAERRQERLSAPLTLDEALDVRDGIAKALYGSLFSWVVARINRVVMPQENAKNTSSISLLDMFGFENLKENGFEQLCMNYANERLQSFFNRHVFKLEQQEYAKEKIEWQQIDFEDNTPILDLLCRKPVGVMHLLDDESNFPRGTDSSFIEKCHYNHALNELYLRPRSNNVREFGVKHFAGPVWYCADAFLEKNRGDDGMKADMAPLLLSSRMPVICEILSEFRASFERKISATGGREIAPDGSLQRPGHPGRFITVKPRSPSVAARFGDSLTALIDRMNKSRPWFVRCIKPNSEKAPMRMDMPLVLAQLRHWGVLATARIRQQGFPVRMRFTQFARTYRCLAPPGHTAFGGPPREICQAILKSESCSSFQLGSTKVLLKESLARSLEQGKSDQMTRAAVVLQRHARGLLARKRYASYGRAAVRLQAYVRMWRARRRYTILRKGVVRAQAVVRGRRARMMCLRMKEDAKRRRRAEAAAFEARQTSKKTSRAETEEEFATAARRSVAAVSHLEVPAELAFVFSKSAEWQGRYAPHSGGRHIVRSVGSPPLPASAHYRLPHDVDQHAFTKFANVFFKSHLWGMTREPIKTPFLAKRRDADYAESLAIFKLILRFMNDPALAGAKEALLGNYIAFKGMRNERMRDEVLCQLSNQTWRNENAQNAQRGWLMMATCLSVFPPSHQLYKYLLKYVSDHGFEGYASLCQSKLLASYKHSGGVARSFGPSELEWRANRVKTRMALTAQFQDGESATCEVESWTVAEDFCSTLLQERGVSDSLGWSVTLTADGAAPRDVTHLDYVLDLIAETELPPAFPVAGSNVLHLDKLQSKPQTRQSHQQFDVERSDESSPIIATKLLHSGPPIVRKVPNAISPSSDGEGTIGLSRSSALNDRYFFDDPAGQSKGKKSRSLDNLIDSTTNNMSDMCLSGSKLNERYHSIEHLTSAAAKFPQRSDQVDGELNDMPNGAKGYDEHNWGKFFSMSNEKRNGNDEDDDDIPKAEGKRFVKASPGGAAGKRALAGSCGSRAHIERSVGDYTKSSALSDTSETPSLASHVRRVRVPSQASDVDQFFGRSLHASFGPSST